MLYMQSTLRTKWTARPRSSFPLDILDYSVAKHPALVYYGSAMDLFTPLRKLCAITYTISYDCEPGGTETHLVA